jgi:tetratricopeptide (TPR) repeat protein
MLNNNLFKLLRNNFGIITLLLILFLIYKPSLNGEFVWDDLPLIKDNPYMQGNHIADFFTKGMASNSEDADNSVALYRPIVLIVFSLCHQMWGDNPIGYHILLVLLHLSNTALIYLLIRKITSESTLSATLGAAIFALHPTRVESIAWVSGLPDPLATTFLLGAMLAYIYFVEDRNRKRYLILSFVCFQLALWSKEVAIMFPLIVVAYDLIYRKKANWPATFIYASLVLIYFATRSFVFGTTAQSGNLDVTNPSKIVDFILGYSELLVYPVNIPYDLQIPEHRLSSLFMWVSTVAIAMLAGYSWRSFNLSRKKSFTFSVTWLCLFFWQAILITFSMNGYAARYMYVPSVGIAIYVSILFGNVIENYPSSKFPVLASFVSILTFYTVITWNEIPYWHDDGSLFNKVIEVAPENIVNYRSLGGYYLRRNDYVTAEKVFLISLNKAKTRQDRALSLLSLGNVYGVTNKPELGERCLKEVLQIIPKNSEALTGLGNLAGMQGNFTEAIAYYKQAIASNPKNRQAAMNLEMAYEKTGQFELADSIKRTIH